MTVSSLLPETAPIGGMGGGGGSEQWAFCSWGTQESWVKSGRYLGHCLGGWYYMAGVNSLTACTGGEFFSSSGESELTRVVILVVFKTLKNRTALLVHFRTGSHKIRFMCIEKCFLMMPNI